MQNWLFEKKEIEVKKLKEELKKKENEIDEKTKEIAKLKKNKRNAKYRIKKKTIKQINKEW